MMIKLLRIGFLLLFLPLVFFAIFLQTKTAREWTRAYLEKELADQLGGKAVIGSVDQLSIIHLKARNIAFYNKEKESGFLAESISVNFSPFSLFYKVLKIPSLTLNGLIWEIEKKPLPYSVDLHASGQWNLKENKGKWNLTLHHFETKTASIQLNGEISDNRLICDLSGFECETLGTPFSHFQIVIGGPLKPTEEDPLIGNFHIETHDPLQGELQGTFSYNPKIGLDVPKIFGNLGPILCEGEMKLTPEWDISEAILIGKTDNVALLTHNQAQGELDAILSLSGHLLEPYFSFTLNTKNFFIRDQPIYHGNIQAKAYINDSQIVGNLKMSLTTNDYPVHFSSDFSLRDFDKFKLNDLLLTAGQHSHIEGNLKGIFSQEQWYGDLTGSLKDLSEWQEMIGFPISGTVDLNSHLEKTGMLSGNVTVTDLFTDTLQLKNAQGSFSLSDFPKHPNGTLQLTTKNLTVEEIAFTQAELQIRLDPSLETIPFQLNAEGESPDLLSLSLEGTLDNPLTIQKASGKWAHIPFRLSDPVALSYENEQLSLSPTLLLLEQGSLYASLNLTQDHVHATVRVIDLPIEPISPLLFSSPVMGLASLEAYIDSPKRELTGTFTLDIQDLTFPEAAYGKFPPLSMHLNGSLFENILKAHGDISGVGKSPFTLDANIPLILAPSQVTFLKTEPLNIQLTAESDLEPILQLFPIKTSSISGFANIHLAVDGSLENPIFSGSAEMVEGQFESFELGTKMKNIRALFRGNGNQITLSEFSATDGKQGRIRGRGTIEFDSPTEISYLFSLDLQHCLLIELDNLKGVGGGQITLEGDLEQAKVEGTLIAEQVHLSIPKHLSPSLKRLPVTYINQPPGIATKQEEKISFPITCDLTITVPKRARVTDTSLASEWKGELRLQGPFDNLKYFGEFKLIDGKYQFQGKTFLLEQGTVTFNGDLEEDATINVIATMEVERTKIEAVLRGDLYDPNLTLRSSPPLSQKEILSLLLFNKVFTASTPADSPSSISTTLTTGGEGEDMLSRFRSILGIDRIDFSRSSSKDMSVQVGKYIDNKTFIILKHNIRENRAQNANLFGIERELPHHLKLQAEVGDDASGHLNLLWKRDY